MATKLNIKKSTFYLKNFSDFQLRYSRSKINQIKYPERRRDNYGCREWTRELIRNNSFEISLEMIGEHPNPICEYWWEQLYLNNPTNFNL